LAGTEAERAMLVRSISDLARATKGDLHRVEQLVREIRDHPEHIEAIEKAQARRKRVEANQRLGRLVEELLQQELRARGLKVERTGVGSDFEVQRMGVDSDFEVESDFTENQQEVLLRISGTASSVLIEVKSARSE